MSLITLDVIIDVACERGFIAGWFTVSLVIEKEGTEDLGNMPWHFFDK